jgi:CRISPR system Cascade subunit CasA
MKTLLIRAVSAGVLTIAVCGCQHIPRQPLDTAALRDALDARPVDIAPVKAYAAALQELDASDGDASFDASDGLSLNEGLAVALWYNPDLRIARLSHARAAAVADEAGRWPDPGIALSGGEKEVEGTEIVSADPADGSLREKPTVDRSWISMASLSITIPLSGRLRAERRMRDSEAEAAMWATAEAEWQTLETVQSAWANWSAARAHEELLEAHLTVLGRFADTANALAEAGELLPASARLFTIERARTEADLDRARARTQEHRTEVLRLLGLVPGAPVKFIPTLDARDPEPAPEPMPENHPRIARLRAGYEAAEHRLRVELRKQYPDITLSPTFEKEEDETAVTLGLGFPIPVWNLNREGIADAAAARDIARAEVEAAYQGLIAEASQARTALDGSRAQRERLVADVAPAVDTQLEEALELLEIGEIDIVLIYEALAQALLTKQQLIDAMVSEVIATSRLTFATATGSPAGSTQLEKLE